MMADSSQHASRQRKQRNSRRHQARILAMQMMYESDMTGHSTSEILIRTRTQGGTPDETLEYASVLLTGVRARLDSIDAEIERAAPQYPIADLPPVDRAILEIALFEILFGDDVPARAAINEAVGIAQEYGGEASARFVNGVLGNIVDRRFPESSRAR
jgi:transcription antitermination protein NusB